jgi:hypothetical protein
MTAKKWLGTWPAYCDLCNTDLTEQYVFFDAKTKQGPWALLCQECVLDYGIGIGLGRGQMYNAKTLEKLEG